MSSRREIIGTRSGAEIGICYNVRMKRASEIAAFAAHPGEVLSRDDLLDAVWGKDYIPASRTLDQHIVQIRRKLGAAGALIETVRGAGYRLRA